MLYKLKDSNNKTKFVALKPTSMLAQGFLEQKMEQWLADNPSAVLPEDEERVLVISQETPFANVTDILAIDSQGNLLVIEVKRGQTPRDVIAQALEYASDVAEWNYENLNRRAVRYFARTGLQFKSLLEAFQEVFEIAPGDFSEAQFNLQQRIFIVSESIDDKIERSARWLLKNGVTINCISYTCYVSDEDERDIFLDLQEVVRPNQRQRDPARPTTATETPTEDEAISRLPEALKNVYLDLKRRVSEFGPDVQTYATKNYLIFKAGGVFAEIHLHRREGCLGFVVRPEGYSIPEKQSAQVNGFTIERVPDSYLWTLTHRFKVCETSDLNVVTQILRQSYDAVHAAQ